VTMTDTPSPDEALVEPATAARQARRRFADMGTQRSTPPPMPWPTAASVARSLLTQGALDYSATRLQDIALGDATRLRTALLNAAGVIETAAIERERLLHVAENAAVELTVAEELAVGDAWAEVLEELQAGHQNAEGQVSTSAPPRSSPERPPLVIG
jgi:hypothetical protein